MNNKDDDDEDDDDDSGEEEVDIVDDDPIKDISQELVQCPDCQRRMRPEIFSKHPNVCRENPAKKRNIRVFDMTQYRAIRSGDKVIPVQKVSPFNENKSNNPNSSNKRPSQTRSTKRNRRPDDVLVPPVINNFCCPNCKRTFCEKAYDRHVTFCSSKSKQLQQPPSEETVQARNKLDRRIKFAATRPAATFANTSPAIITTTQPSVTPPRIEKQPIQKKSSLPTEKFCFLSIRKKSSDALARCPWCAKPYLPNCIHYCRNSKELFSIHSK
ncbi:unnamed protein product [Rotaria magnacalcarata]|uniref:Zinc finger C2HC domain-containing protein 1A n=1 Tax=Rotaria magnacalcarata TaxID=392030 RepID=A0A814H5G1_9BILA|nr:unnamed protein product [Rotaria magnacalcarata]CAF1664763.1 unnamed protein product [Rotaria magnacalcarata]CAF2095610.1 unnamed protein product [Rotaria magnacalcarata]CAF3875661.1 unnamed protein product [Rotaria magnacalcarata]CAF3892701.1 unnamed protein product [Rotaria magnacalcarata]